MTEINETPSKAMLYAKIAAVTGDMKRVKKGSKHSQGWQYASWDDIAQALNEILGQNKLAVIPSMDAPPELEVIGKNSNGTPTVRAHVTMNFTIACGDTGETETRTWFGHGDDPGGGEKSIAKAITYCQKTFYKSLFVISTGDEDPEGHDYSDRQGWQSEPQQPRKQQSAPKQQAPKEENKPEKPAAANPFADKNGANFMKAAGEMGFDKDRVPKILGMFYPVVNGKVYNSNKHDEMMATLGDWNKLYYDMLEPMKGGELNDDLMVKWFEYMGLKQPFTMEGLQALLPVYEQYMDFTRETQKLSDDKALIGKILKEANLSPWRPEKNELALETLKNHFKVEEIAEEIVEQGIDSPPFATDVSDEQSEDDDDLDPLAGIGGIEF